MADFKIQGITPAVENLKLGGSNVSKIYNGSTLVWPIAPATPGGVSYGFLYNWYAVGDSRNLANTGWSVPTISNQRTLSTFLGGNSVAGGKLKETGFFYWNSPNTGATNTSNFNARGGGLRYAVDGTFQSLQTIQYYWAQEFTSSNGLVSSLVKNSSTYTAWTGSGTYSLSKETGVGVRLIKDTTSLTNGQTGTYTGNNGKVYRTICIGTQEWVADNLVETKYRNLDAIPEVTPNATWVGLSTGARCSYDNDPDNANTPCTGYVFQDSGPIISRLQTAVNLWISNRASAISTYGQINTWCTGAITDMSELFWLKTNFNDDISNWDVSNVTNMYRMFKYTAFNQDISYWNVSSVTNMSEMFYGATSFNQDINSWDVRNVTTMREMFLGATAFNQPMEAWDVSNVTMMNTMFGSSAFNQPLNNWDVSSVTHITGMFQTNAAFNQPLNSWDVSSVTSMSNIFWLATSFNQDIGAWDVSSVTFMEDMFDGATAFNNGGATSIGTWDTSSVTEMAGMFRNATAFDQPIGLWQTGAVPYAGMSQMFRGATIFNQDLTGWCVTLVTSEPSLFSTNSALTSANKPDWGTCP